MHVVMLSEGRVPNNVRIALWTGAGRVSRDSQFLQPGDKGMALDAWDVDVQVV